MDLQSYLNECGLTRAAFAAALKKHGASVTSQAVKVWADKKHGPSPKMFGAIEAATGGKVTRQDLRPDIFGPAPKKRRAA